MMGLAPDGGLFVPERIPQADMALAERLAGESYAALAGYLAGLFFSGDFDSRAVQRELDGLTTSPCPCAWSVGDAIRWNCSTVRPAPSRISAPGSWAG